MNTRIIRNLIRALGLLMVLLLLASLAATAQDLPQSRRIPLTVTNYTATVINGTNATSSTQVVAARPNQVRWYLKATNRSATNIAWSCTGAALTNGPSLAPGESVEFVSPPFFNGALSFRHVVGSTNAGTVTTGLVDIQERWQRE
jgi:hypothetical protein